MRIIYPHPHTLISSNIADPTERDKMFDNFLDTQSSKATAIIVEIDASNCDRFMLFNLDALQIDVELTNDDTSAVVFTDSHDLSLGNGLYKQSLIATIPIFADATLKLTIGYTGGTAKCGYCRAGWSTSIGATKYVVKPGFVDYSVKDTDGFGYTYLSVGAWAKRVDLDILVLFGASDNVVEDLVSARGALVGIESNENGTDYESLRLLGFFKDWKLNMSNLTVNNLQVDFQGVI